MKVRFNKNVLLPLFLIIFHLSQVDHAAAAAPDDFGTVIKQGWTDLMSLLGVNDVPVANAIRPSVNPPKGGRKMDSTKFYRVDVKCTVDVDTSKLINNGISINSDTFVAHSLWFSSAGVDGVVPPSSSKLINVFSFTKDSSGTIIDVPNNACSETFLLRGTDSVLTVSFSLSDTKTLGAVPQVFYSAAKMAVGIVPMLFAGPLGKTIGDAAKAAGETDDPMKAIIAAMNKSPRKVAVPTRLTVSSAPTVIRTAHSKVSLTVTEVSDISVQITKDNDLRASFYTTISTIQASYLSGVTTESATRSKCGSFANQLKDQYSFSKKDSSFLIGYFAHSAFPSDPVARLRCIGNRFNATDIVAYQFIYNVDSGAAQALTQEDIDNFFPENGYPKAPLDKGVAWAYAQKLSNLLSIFGKAEPGAGAEARTSAVRWMGAGPIRVDDLTGAISADTIDMNADELLSKLVGGGVRRFGCFTQNPTVGLGAFDVLILGFPLNVPAGNSANKYELADIIGLRMVFGGVVKPKALNQARSMPPAQIKQVQITSNRAATLEAANANGGMCESGIQINLPAPAKQVATAAAQ
ncbi:hypothetical protein [Tardiphaga sp.]|uniref:hypothetical protein n=1 Tax=Tardiphaga sp. TaxID=1926292 RepID=UPI002610849B|nr:hypothetical protein [Tardiphaga sp.]MDB5616463.1 hypothetical protein [Tardiphaga sp.]